MNLTPQVKCGITMSLTPQKQGKIGSNVKCSITMSLTPQLKQGKMQYYNEPDSTSKIG